MTPGDGPADPAGSQGTASHPRSSRRAAVVVLAALLLLLPGVPLPLSGGWLAARTFALAAAGIALAVLAFSREDWTAERLRVAATRPLNLAVLLFAAWLAVAAAGAELPEPARFEATRHLGGVCLFFGAACGISLRRQSGTLLALVSLSALAAGLLAFAGFGESSEVRLAGAFRNEQLLAAFLCVVLPLTLCGAGAGDGLAIRTLGQFAAVVALAALLATQNRAGWAGGAVGMVVLAVLVVPHLIRNHGLPRPHQLVAPALVVVLAGGLALGIRQSGIDLHARARTVQALTLDRSLRWRLGMWDKAVRMILARPWTGWGPGSFPYQQVRFDHPDVPTRSQRSIARDGPTLAENAHNTYLQLAAETGLPGLALYLGILGAAAATGLRALHRRSRGTRAVLAGALAGLAGQAVSAFTSPAWEFAECSLVFWLLLGIVAASEPGEPARGGIGPDCGRVP